MEIDDPKIESLRAMANAAREELDLAVMFHELWKPTAYDDALREPMGVSAAPGRRTRGGASTGACSSL
jgi:hypothetical protein